MLKGNRHTLTIIWLLLCCATVASAVISNQSSGAAASNLAGLAVLGIASGKVYLVMDHFMELRHSPRQWRMFGIGWAIAAFLCLGGFYLAGPFA